MEVGCEKVGIVNLNGKFDEDVLVSKVRFLEPVKGENKC